MLTLLSLPAQPGFGWFRAHWAQLSGLFLLTTPGLPSPLCPGCLSAELIASKQPEHRNFEMQIVPKARWERGAKRGERVPRPACGLWRHWERECAGYN